MLRYVFGPDTATVPDIAAAIGLAVGIEQFLPVTGAGRTDPLPVTRHRGKIAHDQDAVLRIFRPPQERHHAVCCVSASDPLKPCGIAVYLV